MSLIKKADPFEYDRADSDAWLDFMNDQHRNVKDPAYGALGNDTGNDAPAIQAAITDTPAGRGGVVYMPPGIYRCTSAIVFPTDRQVRLIGAGPEATQIHVPTGTTATPGVIHLRGNEWRQSVEQMQIAFDQPDTMTRTAMTHYVPAIYAQAVARFRVQHCRIVRAWIGIDMRQNSTAEIYDLEMSHFDTGIWIDGALDSIRITHLHDWPFGTTPNQLTALGDELNFGIRAGRCDGLHIENSTFLCGTGLYTFPSVVTTGQAAVYMTNCNFDTFSGIVHESGLIRIGDSGFSTQSSAAYQAIRSTVPIGVPSALQVSNCFFLSDAGSLVVCEFLGRAGGTVMHVNITDSIFFTVDGDQASITADGTAGGLINLNIANNHFNRSPNIAYTAPTIGFGTNVRGTITNNIATDKGAGAGNFVAVAGAFPVIAGNTIPGWGLSYVSPAQPQGGNNIGGAINGSSQELITASGFVQASGLEALSSNTPPFAVRRYVGSLDGTGTRILAHGIANAHQRGLQVQAWYKGGVGNMNPLTIVAVDGTNIHITGGTAGAIYRVVFVYSSALDVW